MQNRSVHHDPPTAAGATVHLLRGFRPVGTWFVVASALQDKKLERLLTHYTMASVPLHVIHAPGRHIPTKVRKFIDFVAQRMAE